MAKLGNQSVTGIFHFIADKKTELPRGVRGTWAVAPFLTQPPASRSGGEPRPQGRFDGRHIVALETFSRQNCLAKAALLHPFGRHIIASGSVQSPAQQAQQAKQSQQAVATVD